MVIFFISFDFSIATFGPLLCKTASFTWYCSLHFTINFWLKDQWESCNKVVSLNSSEQPVRFESENFSVYCSSFTHWHAPPISAIHAVYVLPNLGTLSNSFKLFPLSISFGRSLSLWSSIISAYYCTAHYTTTSVSLWLFLSNRTISTLNYRFAPSLSYVFNFSFPQISANLKSVYRLLPLVWLCFIIKQTPHLNESMPKIHQITTFILTTIIWLISCFYQYLNWERITQGAFKSCTVNVSVILLD